MSYLVGREAFLGDAHAPWIEITTSILLHFGVAMLYFLPDPKAIFACYPLEVNFLVESSERHHLTYGNFMGLAQENLMYNNVQRCSFPFHNVLP